MNRKSWINSLSINMKILAFGATSLCLTLTFLGYITWKIEQQSALLSEQMNKQKLVNEAQQQAFQDQARVLANFEAVQAISRTFSEFTYWLTDLSVSWLNESEDKANQKRAELDRLLSELTGEEARIAGEIKPLVEKYHETMLRSVDAYADENRVLGNSLVSESRIVADKVSKKLYALLEKEKVLAAEVQRKAQESSQSSSESVRKVIEQEEALCWAAYMMMFVAVVACGLLAYFFARSISAPLITIMERLEGGARKSKSTSVELKDVADAVASSSTQQASAVQESVASMAEMRSMITQTVDNARASLDLANQVSERTEDGGRIMESMVSSMESIQQANAQLQEMGNIIDQISAKTGVINDIVFKTQLLAFNASIEAARAGQHGRGFAVVAEEVGNLAEMSGKAATEIQVLLDDSKSQVNNIVVSTEKRVSDGQSVSKNALETFNDISREVYNISSEIQSINDAAREQEQGVEQTTSAMSEMDALSQRNNATAQQASHFADQMTYQSQDLGEIVKALRSLVYGSSKTPKGNQHLDSHSSSTAVIELDDRHALSENVSLDDIADNFLQNRNGHSISADDDSFKPLN